MSIHFHKLAVADVRRETPDCISVAFELPEELKSQFQYQPGQNITVRSSINNQEIRRSYSICSAAHEDELRIAVKEFPGGIFSTWANRELIKGHFLDVLPPTGRFIVHPDVKNKKRYLGIAAGSGITPVLSIISSVLHSEPLSTFTLVYGNRNRNSIIFRDQLDALKNRYMERFALHHILSREITDAEIYSGRITALKCEEMSASLIDFQLMDEIFLCGPEAMIFEIKNWLLARKIAPNKIHYELFTTPVSAVRDVPQETGNTANSTTGGVQHGNGSTQLIEDSTPLVSDVTVKLDGISFQFMLPFEGKTILEAALEQGADLPYSCKGGVCSTCRAKLVEGEVAMDLNYALEPEEVEDGFILCCQSHPTTTRVIVDFDKR